MSQINQHLVQRLLFHSIQKIFIFLLSYFLSTPKCEFQPNHRSSQACLPEVLQTPDGVNKKTCRTYLADALDNYPGTNLATEREPARFVGQTDFELSPWSLHFGRCQRTRLSETTTRWREYQDYGTLSSFVSCSISMELSVKIVNHRKEGVFTFPIGVFIQ